MVAAAERTQRILFPGTQHRSAPHIAEAARMVQSGEIGDVGLVRVWNSGNIAPDIQKKVPDTDPPPGLDWDFYLGPSPAARFNKMRFLVNYRVFSDYAGGYITDFGNHRVDSVHQIMGVSSPHTISAVGRRLCKENAGDIFDLHVVTYQYPGFVMEYVASWVNSHGIGGRSPGMKYYGMRGAGAPYASPPADESGLKHRAERKTFQGADATAEHAQNFIKQVRIGHKGAVDEMTGHSYTGMLKRKTSKNDAEASRLLTRELRKPYDLIQI
jgi:predicted dehydrogenase